MIQRDHETVQLPDGRILGYATYGRDRGSPVLFFHGIPGSRLQRTPNLAVFNAFPFCVYAPDRPGIGLSTFQQNRSLLSWTDDMRQFCDYLEISTFSVMGVSGGAPYALACASAMPDRIQQVSVISGLGPLCDRDLFKSMSHPTRKLFQLAAEYPWLLAKVFRVSRRLLGTRLDLALEKANIHLSTQDQELFSRPEIKAMLETDVAEAFRQGTRGVVQEIAIHMREWNFDIAEIECPAHIWHGTADRLVPPIMAEYFRQRLSKSQMHWVDQGGHFMALDHTAAIFEQLLK